MILSRYVTNSPPNAFGKIAMKLKHHAKELNRIKVQRDILVLILLIVITCLVGSYVARRRIISPVGDNPIIKVVYASEITKNTPQGIIERSNHPKQLAHIRLKESSNGTNKNPNALHNICKAQGKSNEFGYGGMAMMICFDSFEESVRVVDEWLTKRDNEALCYYNKGERLKDCEYLR